MSIHPDSDFDALVARLAGPLAPNVRPAFREACERAVAQLACYGPGIVYRAVAPLQKAFWDPPDWHRAAWDIGQERPGISKLIAKPALEYAGDQRKVRYQHLKTV